MTQPPPAHQPGAAARRLVHGPPPGATVLAPSTPTKATERPTETATGPHTEAPPRTAAAPAPRPGPQAPRHPHTTASATAPRPRPTAPAAATPGAPRHPPMASQPLPQAPAALTAGAIRPAKAVERTMRPPPVPVWVRPHLRPSTPRRPVRTRRPLRPRSALPLPVLGRAAGVLMLRLPRRLGPPLLLLAVATTVPRRRPRTAARRKPRLPRGRFAMLMMIEGWDARKMEGGETGLVAVMEEGRDDGVRQKMGFTTTAQRT